VFFSDSLPERNGTGSYYYDLVTQLKPELAEVEVLQPLRDVKHPRLSVPLPGDPMQRLITPDVFRLNRCMAEIRPQVVVSVTPGPFGLLGLHMARRWNAGFLTGFHSDFEQLVRIYWSPISRSVANYYLRRANRVLCRNSGAVMVNNSKLCPCVEELGAPASKVVGTPLPPTFLESPLRPLQHPARQICYVGRLAEEKNVAKIIEAAARFPDIRFVIAGDGPLRSKLGAAAAPLGNVRFTGWLERDEVIELLDSSSLLLLPSRLETFGSVALEAMARGRSALVSAAAGIADWKSLQDGIFVFDEEESLGDALGRILELPPETWDQKSVAARGAAEALNRETIRSWAEILSEHAR